MDPIAAVTQAFNTFGADLVAQLRTDRPGENLVVSPFSVATVLAAALAGARGRTAVQIAELLRVDPNDAALHESVGRVLRGLKSSELRQAVRVLGSLELDAEPSFLSIARNDYDAPFERIDARAPANVIAEINAWVSEQTAGRIDNLLAPGAITPDTRLVLVAALYFKGAWLRPFDRAATHDAWFRRRGGEKVRVPMMSQRAPLRHAVTTALRVVELAFTEPANGPWFSMVFALPNDRDATEIPLTEIVGALPPTEPGARHGFSDVQITLPRFELSSGFELIAPLRAVGVTDMFSQSSADFTGITDVEPLYVDTFSHRAVIEVDEVGATAAAATFLGAALMSAPPPNPITLVFDRPFAFVLRDIRSNAVLFAGWVEDPAREGRR